MNEHELTNAFENILPEQPSTQGWAGTARRRRQRQRAWAGAAAVAVVAAVAIPLGLGLGNSSPQVQATPEITSSPEAEDGGFVPAACRRAQEENFDATLPDSGKIPDDATKLWLCGGDISPGVDHLAFVGPREALTSGIDAAVSAFNDLTWREGMAIDCASSGELYQLLFEYPDGTTRTVEGNFAPDGCQHFGMPDGIVEGADDYLVTLQGLWETQRASEPPVMSDVTGCPGPTSVFSIDVADLGRGLGCVVQSSSTAGATKVTATSDDLPDDLLTLIRDGLPAGSEPIAPSEPFGSDEQVVLLTNRGDPLTLSWGTWGDTAGFAWNNPDRYVWHPGKALAERMDEYFEQLRQQSDAHPEPTLGVEDTGGLTSKVCADIADGTVKPEDLSVDDDLPIGAERVWLCGDLKNGFGGLGPIEPLITDPDRVIREINTLPPSNTDGSTQIGGLTYHLAIDYPNGTRRVISAQTVNAEWVGGLGARTGGAALLETVKALWQEQRAQRTHPYTGEPAVCGTFPREEGDVAGYESFLPVELSDITRGAVCGLPADATDFTAEPVQRWLEPELVAAIAKVDALDTAPQSYPPRGLPYLVLLNEFGDPTTVAMLSENQLVLPQGTWTPTGEAATLLGQAISGLRAQAFYEAPAECTKFVEGEVFAELADVVSGVACVPAYTVPPKGPELEAGFAAELASRFEAESVAMSWGARSSAVVLRDSEGRLMPLYYDYRNHQNTGFPAGLVNEAGDRVWELPADVKAELELYGFDFVKQ